MSPRGQLFHLRCIFITLCGENIIRGNGVRRNNLWSNWSKTQRRKKKESSTQRFWKTASEKAALCRIGLYVLGIAGDNNSSITFTWSAVMTKRVLECQRRGTDTQRVSIRSNINDSLLYMTKSVHFHVYDTDTCQKSRDSSNIGSKGMFLYRSDLRYSVCEYVYLFLFVLFFYRHQKHLIVQNPWTNFSCLRYSHFLKLIWIILNFLSVYEKMNLPVTSPTVWRLI